MFLMDVRISRPANTPALSILSLPGAVLGLPGVKEYSLVARLEGIWRAVVQCRLRDVEYIAVADQNGRSLASFRFEFLPATSSTAADKTRRRRGTEMGKLLGRLFVCFTIALISFNGYSSQLFVIWPWYGREVSVDLLRLLIPFKYVCFAFLTHMWY